MSEFELVLQQSEQHLRDTLDSISDGFFSFDREWRVTYVNQPAADQGKREVSDLLGKVIWEVEPGLIGSPLEAAYRRVMEKRELEELEYQSQRTGLWIRLRVFPSAGGISVYTVDVSERKQAEENLKRLLAEIQRQKYLLEGLVENSPAAIAVTQGMEHRLVLVNPVQKALFPAIPEFVGRTVAEIWPDHKEVFVPVLDRVFQTGEPFFAADAPWLTDKGNGLEEVFYTFSYSPLRGPDGDIEGVIILSIETTEQVKIRRQIEIELDERKKIEHNLLESENRFRAMADGTPVIIWVTDPEGKIGFINKAYSEFFGVTLEEVTSGSWTMWVHPADTVAYIEKFMECSRERKIFRAEGRVRRSDGQWRWIDSYGQPRFSSAEEFLGMAGSSLDVTDRKLVEKELKHYVAELERSNQALHDFAYIASHDLREPLRKIKAFGHLLNSKFNGDLGAEGKDYIARMNSAADRMDEMLEGLLSYSGINTQGEPFMEVNLRLIVEQVLSDLELRIEETGGKVEVGELPVLHGDPLQLRQLMQNVIGNALKYNRKGEPAHVIVSCQVEGDGYIKITIRDKGIGFDMKDARRIFQPFVRLHGRSEYDGSGMGLAICQKIVERHGGSISAESKLGIGTTFSIILPV
jgi:PAS domain S-box-containing protein